MALKTCTTLCHFWIFSWSSPQIPPHSASRLYNGLSPNLTECSSLNKGVCTLPLGGLLPVCIQINLISLLTFILSLVLECFHVLETRSWTQLLHNGAGWGDLVNYSVFFQPEMAQSNIPSSSTHQPPAVSPLPSTQMPKAGSQLSS